MDTAQQEFIRGLCYATAELIRTHNVRRVTGQKYLIRRDDMKVLTTELEFSNEESPKRKVKMNYVWVGRKDGLYVGTIQTRKQANKLIKLLQETVFVEEEDDETA